MSRGSFKNGTFLRENRFHVLFQNKNMSTDFLSFPLSSKQISNLKSHGFTCLEDVKELSAIELSKELSVSPSEAIEILNIFTSKEEATTSEKSAYDLLKEEESCVPIVTFCAALDEMIGGGIPIGKITEICGAPGMGKTQFGMQIAVDAQIPDAFGGAEGEALYIDTEGSFICERVLQIAESASKHIHEVAEEDEELLKESRKFTPKSIMEGIHVIRCHDCTQLIALSHILDDFITEHSKSAFLQTQVKAIILDSIAFHFRHEFQDMSLRTRLLHGLVQNFMKVAHKNKCAVVFMNQMTTKILQNDQSQLVPALGQSWGHACATRIILDKIDGSRFAHLFKSPDRQEASVPYEITKDGVRDVTPPPDEALPIHPDEEHAQIKRPRLEE